MTHETMTVRQVAELVGGRVEGDGSVEIRSFAAIDAAGEGDLTFAADARRARQLARCAASAAIVGDIPPSAPMTLVRVGNPLQAVATLLEKLAGPEDLPPAGVDPSASVAGDATLGENVAIGPNCSVAAGATIGDNTALVANVAIGRSVHIGRDCILFEGAVVRRGCEIGDRCRLGSNCVIGFDGFGYVPVDGVHHRVPHAGNVVLEEDVDVGACACIDRGKFASTRVGAGTKIDNHVQIAHNCQIGRGCLIAANCGIAGSVKIGDYAVLGGMVGVGDHVTVGERVVCGGMGGITRDVPDGQTVWGLPAKPARREMRDISLVGKLPELFRQVRELQKRIEALGGSEDNR